MKTVKFSLIAATATAALLTGPVTAESHSSVLDTNTDINGEPIIRARDNGMASEPNAVSASNGLDTNVDVNGDPLRKARDIQDGTIVAGAELDNSTDVNGDVIRKVREDGATYAFMQRSQVQYNAMTDLELNELQAAIADNDTLRAELNEGGYDASDVLAAYEMDGMIYIVVDG